MADLISVEEERALILRFADLRFREFEYQGFQGKRRVVSFGWRYDFNVRRLQKTDDIPDFLLSLRAVAAAFGNLPPENLQQVLVTEYVARSLAKSWAYPCWRLVFSGFGAR